MKTKELEVEYFECFRSARPDLQLVEAQHGDAPDFLVRRADSVLGIEVVRFSPAPGGMGFIPEEQETLRDWVLALARKNYRSCGGAPLHVQVLFDDRHPLHRTRVTPLAVELSAFLSRKTVDVLLYEQVPALDDDDLFMPEVAELNAVRVSIAEEGPWCVGNGGWRTPAQRADFDRILASKAPLLPKYRETASELWLLTVFERLPGETLIGVPRHVSFALETDFDRVFALERVTRHCVEIPVNGRPSSEVQVR